jgi:inorganic pyrophosphatase
LTNALDFLGRTVTVTIDRAVGSRHPRHGFLYLLNYGYVPGTRSPDGEELDAYVLGVFEPVADFTGYCLAVIQRIDDDDDKLIVVPPGVIYTSAQIAALTEFQERFFQSTIVYVSCSNLPSPTVSPA